MQLLGMIGLQYIVEVPVLITKAARAAKVAFVEPIEESIDPASVVKKADTWATMTGVAFGRVSVDSLIKQEAPAAEVAIDPSFQGSRSAYAITRKPPPGLGNFDMLQHWHVFLEVYVPT